MSADKKILDLQHNQKFETESIENLPSERQLTKLEYKFRNHKIWNVFSFITRVASYQGCLLVTPIRRSGKFL